MTYTCPDGHTSTAGDYCDVCGAPIGPADAGAASASSSPGAASAPSGLDLGSPGTPPAAPPAAPPTGRTCPNCSAENLPDALFCEDCGYDFTTGQLPRQDPPPLAPPDPGSSSPPPLPGPPPLPTQATPASPAAGVGQPPVAPSVPPSVGPAWAVEQWIDPDWYAAQDATDPCPSPGTPVVVVLTERSVLVGRTSASRNIHPQVDCSADTGVSRRHAQLTTDGQRWWVEDLQSANGTYVGEAGGELPTTPITAGQRVELADDDRIYLGAWTRLVVREATDGEQASLTP